MRLLVNTGESIGRRVFYWREYETHQEDTFAELVNGGELVFDIGANIGIYSLLAARRGAKVIAFEPSRLVRRYLTHNVTLNTAQVTIVPEAVSDAAGTVPFFETRPGNLGVGRIFRFGHSATEDYPIQYEVASNTLDHYTAQLGMPRLVKMDIEGAECLALAGGGKTLAAVDSPILMVEFHPGELTALGSSVEDCMALLASHRYRRYCLLSGGSHQWFVFSKRPVAHLMEA
jgi:FkbM family methyltransferase